MAQEKSTTRTDPEAELGRLQTQRVEALKKLADLSFMGYRQGEYPLDQLLAAQHDLIDAQLDMTEVPGQRFEILESHIKVAEQTLEAAEKLRDAKEVSQCDPLRAEAALLGIKIKLMREQEKLKGERYTNDF
jgi:outer membrane protein TolC